MRLIGSYKNHGPHKGFDSHEEAQRWLVAKLADFQRRTQFRERPRITFSEALPKYLAAPEQQAKASLKAEGYLLQRLVPYIGSLELAGINDDSLAP